MCARAKSQLNQFDRIELPDPHRLWSVVSVKITSLTLSRARAPARSLIHCVLTLSILQGFLLGTVGAPNRAGPSKLC